MLVRRTVRGGATTVESAFILPVVVLMIFCTLVGALGIFRYQEVASLARRATRYAAVHGTDYAKKTGNPAATSDSIYTNVIQPYAAVMDVSKLSYSVSWDTGNSPWHVVLQNGKNVFVQNMVSVTVSYNWIPEVFGVGVTLTSTSTMPMSF